MAVSFSNTHLRIPEGFSELLMGLSKEVLRDQPEDIPSFAASYFKELLRQRNESNLDASKFTEKLRDKFYNVQTEGPEIEAPAEITTSEERIHRSRTDSESNRATEISTTQQCSSQEEDSSESEVEEQHEAQRKHSVSEEKVFREEEPADGLITADQHPDRPSESEYKGTTVHVVNTDARDAHEEDSCAPGSDLPQTASDDVLSLIEELNVCAQELGITEDGEGNKQGGDVVDVEASDSEGEADAEVEEPTEMSLQGALAEVDICASELGLTEREIEKISSEVDFGTEDLIPQNEETLMRTSTDGLETSEGHQPEVEHQAEMTEEEAKTESEALSDERSEGSHSDPVPVPEEESLVEVNFEDVPDFQQTTEAGKNQPEDEGSGVELLTEELDVQDEESEIQEVTSAEVESGSGKEPEDEPDMETGEKELKSEKEEMENQVEIKEVTDFNLNNNDDDDDVEKEKSVTEEDDEVPDEGTHHTDTDDKDENTQPRDFDLSYETTDTGGEDGEDSRGDLDVKDGDGDDGVDGDAHSSAIAQPNTAVAAAEGENETAETSAEHLSEQHEGALPESGSEKEVTEEESGIHSEVRETSEGMCEEENVVLALTADDAPSDKQGEEEEGEEEEEEPELEVDSTQQEMEGSSGKQEECSRPQEEEEDIMDIPLDDPEANRAAAKIQAGFRGHMTRKKMKPEDKAEGEEVSSTGEVLNGSQGATATGGTGAVESDDTSVPEQ